MKLPAYIRVLLAFVALSIISAHAEPLFTPEETITHWSIFKDNQKKEFCLVHKDRLEDIKGLEQKCRVFSEEYLKKMEYQFSNGGCPSTYKCVPGNPSTNRLLELMQQETRVQLMLSDLNGAIGMDNTRARQFSLLQPAPPTALELFEKGRLRPNQPTVPIPYDLEKLKSISIEEMEQIIRDKNLPSTSIRP